MLRCRLLDRHIHHVIIIYINFRHSWFWHFGFIRFFGYFFRCFCFWGSHFWNFLWNFFWYFYLWSRNFWQFFFRGCRLWHFLYWLLLRRFHHRLGNRLLFGKRVFCFWHFLFSTHIYLSFRFSPNWSFFFYRSSSCWYFNFHTGHNHIRVAELCIHLFQLFKIHAVLLGNLPKSIPFLYDMDFHSEFPPMRKVILPSAVFIADG